MRRRWGPFHALASRWMTAFPEGAGDGGPGVSPFDTFASSGTRFVIEVIAWITGPWAAADILGSRWWALPTAVVLFALPALFNPHGDKKTTGIPTPGPIRILIERLLLLTAVAVTLVGVALLATGLKRYRWLAAHSYPSWPVPNGPSVSPRRA
jgi:hypothetical protein